MFYQFRDFRSAPISDEEPLAAAKSGVDVFVAVDIPTAQQRANTGSETRVMMASTLGQVNPYLYRGIHAQREKLEKHRSIPLGIGQPSENPSVWSEKPNAPHLAA